MLSAHQPLLFFSYFPAKPLKTVEQKILIIAITKPVVEQFKIAQTIDPLAGQIPLEEMVNRRYAGHALQLIGQHRAAFKDVCQAHQTAWSISKFH
jgi:hypothetical protein